MTKTETKHKRHESGLQGLGRPRPRPLPRPLPRPAGRSARFGRVFTWSRSTSSVSRLRESGRMKYRIVFPRRDIWSIVIGVPPLGTSLTVFRCVFIATSTPALGFWYEHHDQAHNARSSMPSHHHSAHPRTGDGAGHDRSVLQLDLDLLIRKLH